MNKREEYAKYNKLPQVSYKIIEHLIQDKGAELFWKLIKYNDSKAYEKENLTIQEKRDLIYAGQDDYDNYNIFFDFMLDDAIQDMKTIVRIYPNGILPTNRVTGICQVNIEVFVHSKINHLSNYTTRLDNIIQQLLQSLNGYDVGGLGVLYFDNQASRYDRVQSVGNKPFKGKVLMMSVNMG